MCQPLFIEYIRLELFYISLFCQQISHKSQMDTHSLGGYIHSGVFKWFVITDDLKLFFWQDRIINLAVGGFTSLVVLVSINLRHYATELFLSSTSFLHFVWSLQLKAILSFGVLRIYLYFLSVCVDMRAAAAWKSWTVSLKTQLCRSVRVLRML